MNLGYTEFSFGYAFTENLIRSSAQTPSSAPQFPNLIQEARLGYDVRIDLPACPLFFQFKLPELMVRDTALEISQHKLPLSCDFFRMPLMRGDISNQHQILIELEAANAGLVYYASPMLDDFQAFNSAYNLAAVHRHTAFFSPQDIGPLPDNHRHMVSYNANAPLAWFCSEPQKIKLCDFDQVLEKIDLKFQEGELGTLQQVVHRTRDLLQELGGDIIAIDDKALRLRVRARIARVRDSGDLTERELLVTEEILVIREITRIGFGLELVFTQPFSKESG